MSEYRRVIAGTGGGPFVVLVADRSVPYDPPAQVGIGEMPCLGPLGWTMMEKDF